MIKKIILCLVLVLVPVVFAENANVLAASGDVIQQGVDEGNGGAPANPASLDSLVKTIINLLSVVVGIAAIIMIILAGLAYITSGGNSEKTKTAKNRLVYVVIGLVIVALSQTIARFVLTQSHAPSTTSSAQFRPFEP